MADAGSVGLEARLRAAIRDVPDFPKPGVVFKDITPVLLDAGLFADVVKAMAAPWRGKASRTCWRLRVGGFCLGLRLRWSLGRRWCRCGRLGSYLRRDLGAVCVGVWGGCGGDAFRRVGFEVVGVDCG